MTTKARHLLHLAALALLFYLFALTARVAGVTVAVAVFLPLGILFELRFWRSLVSNVQARIGGLSDQTPDEDVKR